MGGLTAQKNLPQAPHTHPTLQGTPWGTSVPAQLAHSCQQRAGVWHADETAATLPGMQVWVCGFTWPAAGVPGISTGYEGVWPFFP